jgi:Secretory lipase
VTAATTTTPRASHRRLFRALLVLVVVLIVLVAAWSIFVWWAQPGDPPAFYTPPAELPAGPPGTIVRSETVDAGSGQRAWRVLYTSTDPAGAPIAVSGVVVAPDSRPPDGGWPVVAWAHGTTGVDRRCAPSLDFPQSGLEQVPELDDIVAAGNVVAITDYPGLGTPGPHPYLVGQSAGRAVLDSIRAARGLLGDDAADTTAIFGHSQGGHAAVWADQLAGTYAPELHVVGVAAMAPPTNLGELLDADKDEAAGIVLTGLAIASWSAYYPDADEATIVEPVARPFVHDLGEHCIATTAEGITDLPDVTALKLTFLSQDPSTAPGWGDHVTANAPGDVSTTIPLLVAQGLSDTIVRPEVTATYVRAQCEAGATIQYDTYPGVGHFEVRTAAAPTVRDWLLARLRGTPVDPGCTTAEQPPPAAGGG